MRRVIILGLMLLLLAACNLRENNLLPPDLSPTEYLTGNTIQVYANYLIKSPNDDSYLYIPKESIADSLINYGDFIYFRKVSNFTSRDTLLFQEGTVPKTATYQFTLKRGGVLGTEVKLSTHNALGRVYTNLEQSSKPYHIINYDYYLQAKPVQPTQYGENRCFFPVYSSGEFSVFSFIETSSPHLQFGSYQYFHALLVGKDSQQLAINFPTEYSLAASSIDITMEEGLNPSEQTLLQRYFPNAVISTPVVHIQTDLPTGAHIAYMRYQNAVKGYFGTQWTRITDTDTQSWAETDADNGTPNWWMDSTGLYSFVTGSGKYFLLTPQDTQTELSIPLDGSVSQVLLQDLWFDLNGIQLPNTTMKLTLNPNIPDVLGDYFSGKPYQINGNHQAYNVSFWQGEMPLNTLPDNAWIEFGFRTTLPETPNDRLFRVYRDNLQDLVTCKNPASNYDASHYSRVNNYVYCGINTSATYLYGSINQSPEPIRITWFKSRQYVQLQDAIVSWWDNSRLAGTQLQLSLSPQMPNHPWVSGEPFTLSQADPLAEACFYTGTQAESTLPANFLLSLPVSSTPETLILFNNQDYPHYRQYSPGSSHTADTFVAENGFLNIYPEFPGILIAASVSYPNPIPVRVYSTMKLSFGDIRLYTNDHAPAGQSAVFSLLRSNALADPYSILGTQYSLTQTSPVYTVSSDDRSNFTLYEPVLYFRGSTRGQNLLFYETTTPYYRLYPYTESADYDPWHLHIDNGFNGVALAYAGSYASFVDNDPHTSLSRTVASTIQDMVLSLYQAQFTLPAYFADNGIPLSSNVQMNKLPQLPGVANQLSAYSLLFTNPTGGTLFPNFYNIAGATQEPYLHIPVENIAAIPNARFFYQNLLGIATELTRVDSFGDNYAGEYTVLGNTFTCTVNNPGVYYITGTASFSRN